MLFSPEVSVVSQMGGCRFVRDNFCFTLQKCQVLCFFLKKEATHFFAIHFQGSPCAVFLSPSPSAPEHALSMSPTFANQFVWVYTLCKRWNPILSLWDRAFGTGPSWSQWEVVIKKMFWNFTRVAWPTIFDSVPSDQVPNDPKICLGICQHG